MCVKQMYFFFVIYLPQDSQTELVLFILLRLVEDVVAFQNLPPQRRKDLQSALTSHMGEIMAFLLQLLQQHTERYKMLLVSVRLSNFDIV